MNLLEASTFTEEECWDLLQRYAAKDGYTVSKTQSDDSITLNLAGSKEWSTQHMDPKVAYLSALGWLESQKAKSSSPIWKPRKSEIDLKSPEPTSSKIISDLEPSEISSVYRNQRK